MAEAATFQVASGAGGGFAVALVVDLDGRGTTGSRGRGGAEVGGCEEGVVRLEGARYACGGGALACGWGVGETGEAGVGDRGGGAGVAGEGV